MKRRFLYSAQPEWHECMKVVLNINTKSLNRKPVYPDNSSKPNAMTNSQHTLHDHKNKLKVTPKTTIPVQLNCPKAAAPLWTLPQQSQL